MPGTLDGRTDINGLVSRAFAFKGNQLLVGFEAERQDVLDLRVSVEIGENVVYMTYSECTELINELLYARDHAAWDESEG